MLKLSAKARDHPKTLSARQFSCIGGVGNVNLQWQYQFPLVHPKEKLIGYPNEKLIGKLIIFKRFFRDFTSDDEIFW